MPSVYSIDLFTVHNMTGSSKVSRKVKVAKVGVGHTSLQVVSQHVLRCPCPFLPVHHAPPYCVPAVTSFISIAAFWLLNRGGDRWTAEGCLLLEASWLLAQGVAYGGVWKLSTSCCHISIGPMKTTVARHPLPTSTCTFSFLSPNWLLLSLLKPSPSPSTCYSCRCFLTSTWFCYRWAPQCAQGACSGNG